MSLPNYDVIKAVETARETSEFLKEIKEARSDFALLTASPALAAKAGFHPLTPAQIGALSKQGNTASDWKSVRAAKGFDPARVSNCHFAGPVLLSSFTGTVEVEGVEFPTGLSHSVLSSCVVGKNVFLRNVRLINKSVIREGAVLFDVGALTIDGVESFANGLEVLIAIETGGREIPLFAELTVEGAWVLSRSRGNQALIDSYAAQIQSYVKAASAPFNVVGPKAKILHTPRVTGIFLGPSAVIDSAAAVSHAAVLSAPDEATRISDGALVKSSILQWGSEVTSGAIVDSSLLTEHSHVERHGKVTHSLLGPNTGVAEGEVTSALLGPFVGFHHQSLLIAALWPEGKGNVAYGANIGSNHTAKAPDQEIWPGEGTFFGLGVNVKFPTDLTRSPYSIIASCVNMLPQKVEFPFSLINTPASAYSGISPAYNEILPGWVLSDNIYMVKRNEGKYQKRNKAKRSRFLFEVFRPDIVDGMADARNRLQVPSMKELYTSKEIRGLGKNYLLEASRKRGVETYTFYIRAYALSGLKRELAALAAGRQLDVAGNLLKSKSSNARWEHERQLINQEFPGVGLADLLKELVRMQEKIAEDVQSSKEKDDKRGAEVIEDYAAAHKPASQDSFVKETWGFTEQLKKEVQQIIAGLSQSQPRRISPSSTSSKVS
ncbi:MAG: DUF4954 family protein [Candidatus Omnitrophica bacterium]|nr:DUF4954 family protein [Candidatus Omnitrophota bacterium]